MGVLLLVFMRRCPCLVVRDIARLRRVNAVEGAPAAPVFRVAPDRQIDPVALEDRGGMV